MNNSDEALAQIEKNLGLPNGLLVDSGFGPFANRDISALSIADQQTIIAMAIEELSRDAGVGLTANTIEQSLQRLDYRLRDVPLSPAAKSFIDDHCPCK